MMKFKKILTATAMALSMAMPLPAFADTDVSHNWNADNEAETMRIFREKYESLGGVWKDTAFPDTQESITSAKTRFIGGNPPMAIQSALGGTLQDFAEGGLLQNMDAVAKANNWAANVSDSIAAVGQYDGHWVAAPVFVDVINWMYTNNEVLAAAGVEAPNTWTEFKAALAALKSAGYTGLAIGGSDWQEAILFDHVILGVGGAELYDAMMTGDKSVFDNGQVRTALEEIMSLAEYTDDGKAGRSWNDTNTLMVTGKAGFFFMGPWAAGGYGDMGDEGGNWSCRLTPWASALTVVPDGFQFIAVESDADKAAQALFAAAVMDPATQIAAAQAKGTLPATNQASASDFSGCPAKAVDAMAESTSVTHWNGHASDVGSAIKDSITALWNGQMDIDAALEKMRAGL